MAGCELGPVVLGTESMRSNALMLTGDHASKLGQAEGPWALAPSPEEGDPRLEVMTSCSQELLGSSNKQSGPKWLRCGDAGFV
jgi:hypothetical protein